MKYYRIASYLGIAIAAASLIGCGIVPAASQWVTDQIPEPNLAQNRANEYLQSSSASLLQSPSDVNLVQPNQYYLVPATVAPTGTMSMALPPGSNIATQTQTLSEKLILTQQAPIAYKYGFTSVNKATAIKVDQNYENTWEATVLALQAGGYRVSGENNAKGTISFESGPSDAVMAPYILHVAIYGNWKHNNTTVSLLDAKGRPVPKATAKPILEHLLAYYQQVTQVPHPNNRKPVVTVTTNNLSTPVLLMDRDLSVSYALLGKAMKNAGFTIVKVDPKKSAYYFVDTTTTRGAINNKMPLYALYVRSNGVIARTVILDEKGVFSPASVATPILIKTAQQIIK